MLEPAPWLCDQPADRVPARASRHRSPLLSGRSRICGHRVPCKAPTGQASPPPAVPLPNLAGSCLRSWQPGPGGTEVSTEWRGVGTEVSPRGWEGGAQCRDLQAGSSASRGHMVLAITARPGRWLGLQEEPPRGCLLLSEGLGHRGSFSCRGHCSLPPRLPTSSHTAGGGCSPAQQHLSFHKGLWDEPYNSFIYPGVCNEAPGEGPMVLVLNGPAHLGPCHLLPRMQSDQSPA